MTNVMNKINTIITSTKDFSNIDGEQFIEKYLNTLNSKSTIRQYNKSIRDFFEYMYNKRDGFSLQDFIVNTTDVSEYENMWKSRIGLSKEDGGIKTSTFNSRFKGVRSFYDWLKNETTINTHSMELLGNNPFSNTKIKSENDSEGSDPLTNKEIVLMLENPYGRNEHIQNRNKLILELALTTGVRRSALFSICLNNFDCVNDSFVVLTVIDKNNKIARKKIDLDLYERLKKWYFYDLPTRENNQSNIESNQTIFNLTPQNGNEMIKNWSKSVGINKRITFHSLRSTTLLNVFQTNGLQKAKLTANHSNINTTTRYVEKGYKIDDCATNLIKDIKKSDNIKDILSEMSKDEIIDFICNLEEDTKRIIVKNLL